MTGAAVLADDTLAGIMNLAVLPFVRAFALADANLTFASVLAIHSTARVNAILTRNAFKSWLAFANAFTANSILAVDAIAWI